MNEYRLKRPYYPSLKMLSFLKLASCLVVFEFFLTLEVLLFAPEGTHILPATKMAFVLFGLVFIFVGFMLIASVFLWIGMLRFLFTYDGRFMEQKVFWFFVMLFGFQYGAALYYWFVYRKFVQRTLSQATTA